MGEGPEITREFELLLCCARNRMDHETRNRVVSLVRDDLNWEFLISLAHRHKLEPLLYWHLNRIFSEDTPPGIGVKDELEDLFKGISRRNLLLWAEVLKILGLLQKNGISAVPYKGPVLAYSAYNNLTLRSFEDIDLMVRPENIIKVKKLLSTIGYEPEIDFNPQIERKFIKYQKEHLFFNKENGVTLDLHWRFTSLFLPNSSKFNFLDENILRKVEVSGNNITTVPSENMFLILCLHNYAHQWHQLSLLVDLMEFTNNHSDLNWSKIDETAKQLQIKKIVLINLNLLKEILGFDIGQINKEFDEDLNSSKIKEMSLEIKNRIFLGDEFKEIKLLNRFATNIRYRDNLFAGLMDCSKDLFIPTNFELVKINLPSFLFPMYYLLRPFFLLIRYRL